MKSAFGNIAVKCLLVAVFAAAMPALAPAQGSSQGVTEVARGNDDPTVKPYASYAEFALDMLLNQMQGRGLDVFIDPDEYIVGPGDFFGIYFVSGDIIDITCRVSIGGSLFIKSVGSIEVGGLTLRESLERIKTAVEKNYGGSEFIVQLIDFRFIRVKVIGEVIRPGLYYVPSVWRVSEVIDLAGGTTPEALSRRIVLRGIADDYPVDLVRFNAVGDTRVNPFVCKGNTIMVPDRRSCHEYVTISGLVNNPGSFAAVEGDCLADYITYANGTGADMADLNILVSSQDGRITRQLDGAESETLDFIPASGDIVTLVWKDGRKDFGRVKITGEVARPGIYPIEKENFSLNDLLALCGGINAEGCPEMIQIYRRTGSFFSGREYTGTAAEMTTADMFLSGSSNPDDYRYGLVSRSPRRSQEPSQALLADGDSLYVPRAAGMVSVAGAVASPGLVKFEKGRDVAYYLNQAGGLGFDADQTRMVVINPFNGGGINADKAGELFDGEVLFVPRKINGTKP